MHQLMSTIMVIAVWIFIASAVADQSDTCKQDNSGVFLRRYTDSSDETSAGYSLVLLSRNGAVQIDSSERNNPDSYTTDFVGYYMCKETSKPQRAILSYRGIYFEQSEDPYVYVSNTKMNCTDADDDCSDIIIKCSTGRTNNQGYNLTLPNRQSLSFTRPIPDSASSRPISSKRIFSHPSTKAPGQSKCYGFSSGIYILQYSDNTYAIIFISDRGYILSIYSGDSNSQNNFGSSTAVGEWFCSDNRSFSGLFLSFTYATNPADQSLIQSSFYASCPSEQLENCTGIVTDVYYPLQDHYLPFRDGRPSIDTVFTYQSSRLYQLPSPQTCREKYDGVYIFKSIVQSSNATYFSSYLLYHDGTVYSTSILKSGPTSENSNAVGIWDCDNSGNITTNLVFFQFPTGTSNWNTVFGSVVQNYNCNDKASQCVGTFSGDLTAQLELPRGGSFPSAQSFTGGSLQGRRLSRDI